MAKGNKFTGGGSVKMNTAMRQVQAMQEEMERMQQELEEKVIETSAGGGKVKVEMKGTKEIIKLTGTVKCCGIVNDMIMDMCSVCMSSNNKCMLAFGKSHCSFISDFICFLRRYLSRLERLPDLICNDIALGLSSCNLLILSF